MPSNKMARGLAPVGLLLAITVVLVAQTTALHMLAIPEVDLRLPDLHALPLELGRWQAASEGSLEAAVTAYLRPDEYILRDYLDKSSGSSINLFAAHFKSLQNSYGPHSPRVCLPGAGWLIRSSKISTLPVTSTEAIPANEFSLEKSNDRMLVFYWYQNDRRIWAEEFQMKLYLLPDLVRYRRSDVALVRVIAPVRAASHEQERTDSLDFIRTMFPQLKVLLQTAPTQHS